MGLKPLDAEGMPTLKRLLEVGVLFEGDSAKCNKAGDSGITHSDHG